MFNEFDGRFLCFFTRSLHSLRTVCGKPGWIATITWGVFSAYMISQRWEHKMHWMWNWWFWRYLWQDLWNFKLGKICVSTFSVDCTQWIASLVLHQVSGTIILLIVEEIRRENQLRLVVNIPWVSISYKVFYIQTVVVWDFWTINSMFSNLVLVATNTNASKTSSTLLLKLAFHHSEVGECH